jgi:hypothetical protein
MQNTIFILFIILVVYVVIEKLDKSNRLKERMISKLDDLHKSQQLTNQFLSTFGQHLLNKEKRELEALRQEIEKEK